MLSSSSNPLRVSLPRNRSGNDGARVVGLREGRPNRLASGNDPTAGHDCSDGVPRAAKIFASWSGSD
jgi:hypothetical protein